MKYLVSHCPQPALLSSESLIHLYLGAYKSHYILGIHFSRFPLLCGQDLWKNREPPSPLKLDEILAQNATGGGDSAASNGNAATVAHSNGSAHAAGDSACKALGLMDAHKVWNLRENAQVRA